MRIGEARKKRGWTFHTAAAHMRGVSEQQLRNLEGIGGQRETEPSKVQAGTMLEILRTYHPDVSLDDFIGSRTLYRLSPRDESAKKRLRRYALANYAHGAA